MVMNAPTNSTLTNFDTDASEWHEEVSPAGMWYSKSSFTLGIREPKGRESGERKGRKGRLIINVPNVIID